MDYKENSKAFISSVSHLYYDIYECGTFTANRFRTNNFLSIAIICFYRIIYLKIEPNI